MVKTAVAHRPEMSSQFDGSSSVVFYFAVFLLAGKRPILPILPTYINLDIQYYFTFVERVGLNCYSSVLFLIPPLPLRRQDGGR